MAILFVFVFAFAAIVLVAIIAIVSIVWQFERSSSLLDQWAEQHDYRILSQEYRNFIKGPFFWTSTNGQTVYYVVVENSRGKRRSGWVRCGDWCVGLLSDKVEVCWDN